MPATAPGDTGAPSGSVSPEPAAPIGYISLGGSEWYIHAVDEGVRLAAAGTGRELVECDPEGTRDGVRACAERLAEAGVAGYLSMQPFADLADEVCTTVGDVPAVGILYEQGSCQVSFLEVDQAASGRLAGEALGSLAADRWGCDVKAFVALASGAGDDIGSSRMGGFRDGYREQCRLPPQPRTLHDTQFLITAKNRLSAVLDTIRGKPMLVAGVTDLAALGALEAAAEAGRDGSVWVTGQLADPAARQAIACDPHYLASVAQFPDRFGAQAVPALSAAIDGGTVAPRMTAELELVTAENVRSLFPDTPACDT